MARLLRIEFDRVLYHVTSSSNARETIFITDKNRALFHDKKESASVARLKTPLAFNEFGLMTLKLLALPNYLFLLGGYRTKEEILKCILRNKK